MERTDYELIRDCLDGNRNSFSELVTRYKKLVYSVVYKFTKDYEEVDDISQEVFIKIFRSLAKYNPEYKFSTWTVKVANNICLDIVRRKKLNSISIEEIENLSGGDNTPEELLIRKEKSITVRNAIAGLPEIYRTPIILYHQKGLSYKEIADILKQPMSIIKNRLFRARLSLKESLAAVA
jgi:RNA polymerase sigma factor (sigma-70 family)